MRTPKTKVFEAGAFPRRILSYTKIVKDKENKNTLKTLFSYLYCQAVSYYITKII